MSENFKKFLPFLLLIALILVVYLTNLHRIFTIEWLQTEEQRLASFANKNLFLAALLFVGIYIASVCLVIPDSTILTLLGAMIFPWHMGLILAVFSETIGATAFFAIFHTLFGTSFMKRERPFLSKMRRGFKKHSVSYLLFLRVSHVFPFWLTNVAAAYFKIPFWTFIWTTFVGVIPLTFIIANAGHSLAETFARNQPITLSDIFTTQVNIALFVLGIFALCPIIYKKWIAKKKWKI
ncbi:MAG: VTT domain-containing protein [Simkaniaceae bacterium]|nr:VTT domain-containing protein [Candidatus Sacchlamyda saccharinae]